MDGSDETVKMEDQDELVDQALKHFFPGAKDGTVSGRQLIARVYNEYKIQRNYVEYMSSRASGAEAERVKVAKELQEARSEIRKMRETLEELETELDNRKRGNDLLRAKLEQVTLKAQRKAEQEANEYRITPPAGMKILTVYFSTIDEQEEEE